MSKIDKICGVKNTFYFDRYTLNNSLVRLNYSPFRSVFNTFPIDWWHSYTREYIATTN